MLHGDEDAGFIHGLLEFFARDTDVGDVEFVLGEFGAGQDEAPMAFGRDDAALVSLAEEAVFAMLNMVAERRIEHPCERFTLF